MAECPKCGKQFNSYTAMRVHQSRTGHMEKTWRDEDKLEKMYVKKRMSAYEIADELGCGATAVYDALSDYGIDRRSQSESKKVKAAREPACYRTHPKQGYEEWFNQHGDDTYYCRVHRLAAVAWKGFDAVSDSIVHHKKGIPWLNTEENLQIMNSQSKHARMHQSNRERNKLGRYL